MFLERLRDEVPSYINIGYVQISFQLVGCVLNIDSFATKHLSYSHFMHMFYNVLLWYAVNWDAMRFQCNVMWFEHRRISNILKKNNKKPTLTTNLQCEWDCMLWNGIPILWYEIAMLCYTISMLCFTIAYVVNNDMLDLTVEQYLRR